MPASAGLRAFQLGQGLADKLDMIGERIARALAAAVLGIIFGFMLSNEITGALGGAAIGVLLAEFTELPLFPQIQTWRVQKAGREDAAAAADPRIAMSFRDAAGAAQEPAGPSRTTNVFVAAFSLTSMAAGIWFCLKGARFFLHPGDPFWWGLDEMLRGGAGILMIGAGVVLIAIGGFGFRRRLQSRI